LMRARALALLPVVLLLSRCAPRTSGVEVLSSKDVDLSVLGEQIAFPELGVSFRAPRNWRVEAETGMKAAAVGSFTLEPERVFFRDDGVGFCLVSRLVPAEGSANADPLKTYANDLGSTFKKGDNVSYKNLRINRLPGILLRITEEDNLLYKFIVDTGDSLLQIDFAFPVSEVNDSVLVGMKASVSTIRGVQ
jgi:hypothetical protein